jgi:hypothetical protein
LCLIRQICFSAPKPAKKLARTAGNNRKLAILT